MQISYRYFHDADYVKAAIQRQYVQGPVMLRLPVQFGIIGVLFGVLFFLLLEAPILNKVIVALFMASLITAAGASTTRAALLSRFKSRMDFGSEVDVNLSEQGLLVKTRHTRAQLSWEAYPRAVRFKDGILLRQPGAIRWLPDSGIVAGTPEDATEMVKGKTILRYVA